jgi:hypothetical protein
VCVSGTTRERDERSRVVDEENEVLFINPVLGPELVAGSSRLKGGSATKIILDAAFAVAATVGEGRGTGHERGGSSSYDATATTLRAAAELYATRALSAFAAATRKTHASMSRDGACASACARAAAAVAAGGDVRLVSVAEFADVADVTPRVSKKETLSVSPLNETLGVTVSALVDAFRAAPDVRDAFGEVPRVRRRRVANADVRFRRRNRRRTENEKEKNKRSPARVLRGFVGRVRARRGGESRRREKKEKKRASPNPPRGNGLLRRFCSCSSRRARARARRANESPRGARSPSNAPSTPIGAETTPTTPLCRSRFCACARTRRSRRRRRGKKTRTADVEASAFSADAVFVDLADETPDKIHAAFLARLAPRVAELGAKLCLNAVSVAAHALSGKTFAGRMIDVRVSNAKLYHRAARVVAAAAGTDVLSAREALWRACGFDRGSNNASSSLDVSEDEQEDDKVERSVVDAVVARASSLSSVVPIAVLLARGAFREARDARDALAEAGNDVRATLSRVQRPNNTREQ